MVCGQIDDPMHGIHKLYIMYHEWEEQTSTKDHHLNFEDFSSYLYKLSFMVPSFLVLKNHVSYTSPLPLMAALDYNLDSIDPFIGLECF